MTGAVKYANQKSNPQKNKTTLPVQRFYLVIVKKIIRVFFFPFLAFLTKFPSAKVTKFVWFCKQKPWWEKSVIPVGDYRRIPDR